MNYKSGNLGVGLMVELGLAMVLFFWLAIAAFGQTDAVAVNSQPQTETQATESKAVLQPVVTELKEIAIGMTADEVKDKLGKAKAGDDKGFYYVFSDEESMQIELDADKKVRMIATIYTGDDAKAPKFEDVFGSDVAVEKQADGRIYKLVRYPDAGYWVAYSRVMVQDKPMIVVTMQKMRQGAGSTDDAQ